MAAKERVVYVISSSEDEHPLEQALSPGRRKKRRKVAAASEEGEDARQPAAAAAALSTAPALVAVGVVVAESAEPGQKRRAARSVPGRTLVAPTEQL